MSAGSAATEMALAVVPRTTELRGRGAFRSVHLGEIAQLAEQSPIRDGFRVRVPICHASSRRPNLTENKSRITANMRTEYDVTAKCFSLLGYDPASLLAAPGEITSN